MAAQQGYIKAKTANQQFNALRVKAEEQLYTLNKHEDFHHLYSVVHVFACSYPAVNAKYLSTWPLHLHPEYAEAITLIHKLKVAVTARAGQKKPNNETKLSKKISVGSV